MSIPYGDQAQGYIAPDLSLADGVGTLPPEEQDVLDEQHAEQEAQAEEVAVYEEQLAEEVRDERLDTSGPRLASIDPSAIQCDPEAEWCTLSAYGSGFEATTLVNYDGEDISNTEFVSDTELRITLNPAGATPGYVPVAVSGDPTENVVWLTWTPPPTHE